MEDNNNEKLIGTHYGVVFQNNPDKMQESKDFITTIKNKELQEQYLQLGYDIFTQYRVHLERYLHNSDLLSYWLSNIYAIAEQFTHLVERIEKGESCFDKALLNTQWRTDQLTEVFTLKTEENDPLDINLHDLLNYLSSKLYMIAINLLKDMQSVLIKQVHQNITANEYNQINNDFKRKLTNSFLEVSAMNNFWKTREIFDMFTHPALHNDKVIFSETDVKEIWNENAWNELYKLWKNNYEFNTVI